MYVLDPSSKLFCSTKCQKTLKKGRHNSSEPKVTCSILKREKKQILTSSKRLGPNVHHYCLINDFMIVVNCPKGHFVSIITIM